MKNPSGALSRGNMEWGRKHRKEEDELRSLNARGRAQAIEEQLQDVEDRD